MIHKDYIPGPTAPNKSIAPRGYDYWLPHWRLENGKIIKDAIEEKVEAKLVEAVEVAKEAKQDEPAKEEKGQEVFSCNKCEFSTKSEPGIKRHITTKHKG